MLRSSVTFRRVKCSTLVSSESKQEQNASSVMVEDSRTTPLVFVGAGVVMEICRLSMSALFDHARVLVEIRRVIKHFLFVKTESENIWSIKQL